MAEVKILLVTKTPSFQEGRRGKTDRIVNYQLDSGRRGFVIVPDEGFTDAALVAAIRKDLEEAERLIGKTLQL